MALAPREVLIPAQYICWSVGGGASARLVTRNALIDLAAEILGRRFVPMCDDLHVGPQRQEVTDRVRELSGRFVTGLEMMCRVSPPGPARGGDGGPRGSTSRIHERARPSVSADGVGQDSLARDAGRLDW